MSEVPSLDRKEGWDVEGRTSVLRRKEERATVLHSLPSAQEEGEDGQATVRGRGGT